VALARAGAQVSHVGAIGADGLWLRDFLQAEGVDISGIVVGDGLSGLAMIQVRGDGENAIVLSPGANREIDPHLIHAAIRRLPAGSWFLCQNETNAVPEAIRAARSAGHIVCVNPAPMDSPAKAFPYEAANWVIVNETEAAGLLGEDSAESVLQKWQSLFPGTGLVLTLGADGSVGLVNGQIHRQPAIPAEVVDTTAAGDTFVGFLLHALAGGSSLPAALERAARASAFTVSRPGAAASIPRSGDIE
jgi:ribokinase